MGNESTAAAMAMKSRQGIALAGVLAVAVVLAGCATTPRAPRGEAPALADRGTLEATILQSLQKNDANRARIAAEQWLAQDMRAPKAHLYLGAAHQLKDDPAQAEVAGSGFEAANRLGDTGPWPHYLTGVNLMRQQRPAAAADAFALAVMADPNAGWAYEGLAAAAYLSGDLPLAYAAAEQARRLDPQSTGAWRTAVLSAAGGNDPGAVDKLLAMPPAALTADDRAWVAARSAALMRTSVVDDGAPAPTDFTSSEPAVAPQQLTVDVTLILGDMRNSTGYGVNLLESLQLQFGRQHNRQTVTDVSGSAETTSITRLIRIPDITYNLNILNRARRQYEVIARPSLSAFLGEQSTFFVGEQLNVAVAGVNFAQLERIDVGVGLKITPSEIRSDGARFRVEADRSFFSDQGVGSFSQQLATFRQNVAATADVRFGETLVLSGLSESVNDRSESGVPVLGDVPGLDLLFNRKTDQRRQRSVIILVTPSPPVGFATGNRRGEPTQRLLQLWESLVEPGHGLDALTERVAGRRFFSRATVGDVRVRGLSDPQLMQTFLASARDGAGVPAVTHRTQGGTP
ncbi:MAG: hypothetical protein DCF27_03715 [Lysobacteraceae bacterium]|nr:MAG: hypothetical protein DCF27_03715 [Xanthomonadaceae bacterium]